MRKLIHILLIVVLLLVLPGCSLPSLSGISLGNKVSELACEGVTIGVLIGESSDTIAQEQRDGYEMALEEINLAGGIDGCQLSLSYREESVEGNSNQTYTAIRSLVEEDSAVGIVGGTDDAASMYAASLVNYYNIPLLIPSAGGDHIMPEENLWAFRLRTSESEYSNAAFDLIKGEMGSGKNVTILFEDTTFGHDGAIAAVNAINQYGMAVSGYIAFDPTDSTYDAIAAQVETTAPDIIYLIFSVPEQAEAILDALNAVMIETLSLVIARSGAFGSYAYLTQESLSENPLAANLVLISQWTNAITDVTAQTYTDRFSEYTSREYGEVHTPTMYSAEAYKSLVIMSDAVRQMLQASGILTPDLTNQRETVRQNLFAYKENTPLWGTIDFSDSGQNLTSVYLLQMKDGVFQVIYPTDISVTDLTILNLVEDTDS